MTTTETTAASRASAPLAAPSGLPDPSAADAHLREVLALHLHPEHGSRYWLQTEHRLGWSICDRIRGVADLWRLGTLEAGQLRGIRAWDFVPRGLHRTRDRFIVGETGGTSGLPAATVYDTDDFHAAFVAPFLAAARCVGFPRAVDWLFVGPSGPHLIGKAARELARALESPDPWTVDFDPRWVRTLASPLARQRYLEHVVSQACQVLAREEIGVLFTTPPVLHALSQRLDNRQREQLRAIHYGGLALTAQTINHFRRCFPKAVHLAGYGNTLFGCALEATDGPREALDYFPHGPRLVFEVLTAPPSGEAAEANRARLRNNHCLAVRSSANGRSTGEPKGQVVFHRIDRSCLLVGIRERDWAQPVPLPLAVRSWGSCGCGLRNPATPSASTPQIQSGGIY